MGEVVKGSLFCSQAGQETESVPGAIEKNRAVRIGYVRTRCVVPNNGRCSTSQPPSSVANCSARGIRRQKRNRASVAMRKPIIGLLEQVRHTRWWVRRREERTRWVERLEHPPCSCS